MSNREIIRALKPVCLLALLFPLAFAVSDRAQTEMKAKDFPGWQEVRNPRPLQPGIYVAVNAMGFSQEIVLKADGHFESQFAGEVHKKRKPPEWTERKFTGRWIIDKSWITFVYNDGEGHSYSYDFLIGSWDSRPAFIFSRGNDNHCPFIAECYVKAATNSEENAKHANAKNR